MSDFYIEDFRTLEEILDFIQEQIEEKIKEFHQPKPTNLRKDLETILKKDYPSVVEEYGLKNGKELPDVLANRIIHELFAKCVRSAYLLWYEENRIEIDEDSPYSAYELDRTINEIEKQYKDDGVSLDAEAWVYELKHGLQYTLLEASTMLKDAIMDDELVLDIKAKGNLPIEEVAKQLKEELGNAKELVKQVEAMQSRLAKLVRNTETR